MTNEFHQLNRKKEFKLIIIVITLSFVCQFKDNSTQVFVNENYHLMWWRRFECDSENKIFCNFLSSIWVVSSRHSVIPFLSRFQISTENFSSWRPSTRFSFLLSMLQIHIRLLLINENRSFAFSWRSFEYEKNNNFLPMLFSGLFLDCWLIHFNVIFILWM